MTSTIWQIVLLSMSLVAGGLAIVELGSAVRQGVASLRTTSEQTASKLAEFHRRFEAEQRRKPSPGVMTRPRLR